jgi:hypothetical protein
MRVCWFNGVSLVGIVEVMDPYDGLKYYIGSPPQEGSEDDDMRWIADWGARFPMEVGKILFGEDEVRSGKAVPVPVSREHAEGMVKVGMFYLEQKNGTGN